MWRRTRKQGASTRVVQSQQRTFRVYTRSPLSLRVYIRYMVSTHRHARSKETWEDEESGKEQ